MPSVHTRIPSVGRLPQQTGPEHDCGRDQRSGGARSGASQEVDEARALGQQVARNQSIVWQRDLLSGSHCSGRDVCRLPHCAAGQSLRHPGASPGVTGACCLSVRSSGSAPLSATWRRKAPISSSSSTRCDSRCSQLGNCARSTATRAGRCAPASAGGRAGPAGANDVDVVVGRLGDHSLLDRALPALRPKTPRTRPFPRACAPRASAPPACGSARDRDRATAWS